MKILLTIEFFSPKFGGSVISTYELAKHLQLNGHEVVILTSDYQIDSEFVESLNGVEVIQCHCVAAMGNFFVTPSINNKLEKYGRFDIIHMSNFRSYQNIAVSKYSKKYSVPYILQPRGTLPRFSKNKQKKLFDLLFGQYIIKRASKVIASSKIESNQYKHVFPKIKNMDIVRVPNGIDLDDYGNLPKKGLFKKKNSIKENELVILFLSRIHERKGVDLLLEAFRDLKDHTLNVKLVIAGPDENYVDKLKLLCEKLNLQNDVIFSGPLYGANKLEAYVDADIFILPSKDHYESFGNVALEALACGTAVIVTDKCGVSEWIHDVSYVVEPNVDSFEKILLFLLQNDDFRIKYGSLGKSFVKKHFEWKNSTNTLIDIYNEVLR